MDDADFRTWAKAEFVRLLDQYRQVERWIKRAEQVNQKAIIPAMNELRYASRQLFNALDIYDAKPLTPGVISSVRRRITIAEQYMLNAEHDIWDAIVGYYDRVILKLDTEYGVSAIAIVYHNYPALRVARSECLDLISEAREYYERRAIIYTRLREEYFPYFQGCHSDLLDAEVAARETRERLNVEMTRAKAKASRLEQLNFWLAVFGAIFGAISVIGVGLSVYLWLWARDDYCDEYKNRKYLGVVCRFAPPPKLPAAPNTGVPQQLQGKS